MHRSPARLPWGMPGMGVVMEGAIQQAPQPARHFMTTADSRKNIGAQILLAAPFVVTDYFLGRFVGLRMRRHTRASPAEALWNIGWLSTWKRPPMRVAGRCATWKSSRSV